MEKKPTFRQLKEWQLALNILNDFIQAADDINETLHELGEKYSKHVPEEVFAWDLTEMSDIELKEFLQDEPDGDE